MSLSEFELKKCEKAIAAFMSKRRPPPHIRQELDLGYRINGQSIEIFVIRPESANHHRCSIFVIVGVPVLASRILPVILGIYMEISLMTFTAYALDKSAARKGDWRTKESTLHLLSLAGGWPGAIVVQQQLRHKSRKASFRSVFWMTVFLNCGVFVWLTTSTGAAALQSFIGSVVK
jgi:uncharacterized membrane protein YsdA (DUF1294 family)